MGTPARSPEMLAAFVEAYKANGEQPRKAAIAVNRSGGSGHEIFAACVRAGLLEPKVFWKPVKQTTTRDADDNITATYIQERPDTGDMAAEPLPGFAIARRTVHRVGGEITQVWEQEKPGAADALASIRLAAEAMAADLPRVEPTPQTSTGQAALCNLYTFTDYHLGALCWHKEGGADWDLKIAEATGRGSFAAMLAQSPRAAKAIINIQGDMLHTDGLVPVTPAHHHVLDADGRFPKVAGVAVRLIRNMVAMALETHDDVHLIICEGNHDESSSVWLRIMFAALYENEPRVTVNDSELPYYVHQHGKIMLAFHHGHKVKNEALPMLFAAQFSAMWGATTKRYAHCGHRHHVDEKEYSGMLVTQHPTLAARDAYAARGGWISERAAQSITYHAEFGQVARTIVCPEMLEAV